MLHNLAARFPRLLLAAILFATAGAPMLPANARAASAKPKLVLVIVFDQFRADYLTRFESRTVSNTAATAATRRR